MSFDIFDPKPTRVETFLVRDIVANKRTIWVSVIHSRNLPKPLLASRVPYKHAHLLAGGGASTDKAATFIFVVGVDVDSLDFEVPA